VESVASTAGQRVVDIYNITIGTVLFSLFTVAQLIRRHAAHAGDDEAGVEGHIVSAACCMSALVSIAKCKTVDWAWNILVLAGTEICHAVDGRPKHLTLCLLLK
jgi:hypothetical protein